MNMWLTYNGCVKSTDYANRYNGGPHRKSCHCDKQKTKTQELINISKHMNLRGSAKLHVHVLATKVMHYSKSKRLNLTCGIKNTIFPLYIPYTKDIFQSILRTLESLWNNSWNNERLFTFFFDWCKTPQNVAICN